MHAALIACMNIGFGHVIAASACIVVALSPIGRGPFAQKPTKIKLKLPMFAVGWSFPIIIDATVDVFMNIGFGHVIAASACIVVAMAPIRRGAFPPPQKHEIEVASVCFGVVFPNFQRFLEHWCWACHSCKCLHCGSLGPYQKGCFCPEIPQKPH